MPANLLHLLVIFVAFSHLIFLNADPTLRARRLLHEGDDSYLSGNTHKIMVVEALEEGLINGRMDLENHLNDYPGYGANNRHTPKPPERD
ncbi:unnamed protein product [Ilex paraguariensis]|uniref:Uncharacterized protein n=1 Tax=Ilex paraguariensis TaxID=185542 RepID=A0ABC8URS2_9AQUA